MTQTILQRWITEADAAQLLNQTTEHLEMTRAHRVAMPYTRWQGQVLYSLPAIEAYCQRREKALARMATKAA